MAEASPNGYNYFWSTVGSYTRRDGVADRSNGEAWIAFAYYNDRAWLS